MPDVVRTARPANLNPDKLAEELAAGGFDLAEIKPPSPAEIEVIVGGSLNAPQRSQVENIIQSHTGAKTAAQTQAEARIAAIEAALATLVAPSTGGKVWASAPAAAEKGQWVDPPMPPEAAPLSHSHPEYQPVSAKGQASGYASLGPDAKVPAAQLPASSASINALKKTANQSNSLITLADVTDLTFPVAANTDYAFDFVVVFATAAAATGIRLEINGPASPAEVTYLVEAPTAAAGTDHLFARPATAAQGGAAMTAVDAANTRRIARVQGVWRNGANAGNVALQFASEVAASAVTIYRGSWGRWF